MRDETPRFRRASFLARFPFRARIPRRARPTVTMAAVERNVYDERTMSILVTGEEGTDEAETFLQDKLCEQGLKGTRDAAVRCHDARR